MPQLLLAGDIGGTKSNLMVVEVPGEPGEVPVVVAEATYASRRYAGLAELAREFLATSGVVVGAASFSVAGPVVNGRARLPNLGWSLEEEELRQSLGMDSVRLTNDVQAMSRAVPRLVPDQLLMLQEGAPRPGGMKGVIAPGTGLGEALLIPCGADDYAPIAGEGGHADFAPADGEQRDLLAFLQGELGHVSYEHVCSGNGIGNIHRFLLATGRAGEAPEVAERIAAADDPTPLILEAGLAGPDPGSASARALAIFTAVLAAEAGNLALRGLTTGGLYIGGGLPPRVAVLLRRPDFLDAFRSKGRMSELVRTIPLHLILEPRAPLWGAVQYGLDDRRDAPPAPGPRVVSGTRAARPGMDGPVV